MKKTVLFLAAASATAIAVPAAAQDNSAFTGPRVEGIIGYDISQRGSDSDNEAVESDDESIDGFMYGVGVGYDFAVGGAVLGLEAEYGDSTASAEFGDDGDFEDLGIAPRLSAGRDLYLGARAGILVNPNTLLYVKGGYTNATYDLLARDLESEAQADLDLDGWRAGVGAEYAMSENTFVKLEYRYSNYSEGEFDFSDDSIFDDDTGDSRRFDTDIDRHQVAIGVGYRF